MRIFICLTLILSSYSIGFGQTAWSYKGIPYVTDEVPDEIMPSLPDGPAIGNNWPGYDPCTIATPTFTNAATQYYVDTENGNDGTAENSGRGSIAKPRKTLPNLSGKTWTLGEGDQIFITGNSTVLSNGDHYVVHASGSAGAPAWIIGVGDKPNFVCDKFHMGGTHLIIDNIQFSRAGGCRVKFGSGNDNVYFEYGTLRNSLIDEAKA